MDAGDIIILVLLIAVVVFYFALIYGIMNILRKIITKWSEHGKIVHRSNLSLILICIVASVLGVILLRPTVVFRLYKFAMLHFANDSPFGVFSVLELMCRSRVASFIMSGICFILLIIQPGARKSWREDSFGILVPFLCFFSLVWASLACYLLILFGILLLIAIVFAVIGGGDTGVGSILVIIFRE